MYLALEDIFRARWTNQIHEEWITNVLKNRPDLSYEKLDAVRSLMDAHVRDCIVEDYEILIPSVHLPDENDRHVFAAAIKCGADVIVTSNLKDFPDEALRQYGMEAQHPDVFIRHLIDLFPERVCSAARRHRSSLKNPPVDTDQYLELLERQALHTSTAELRRLIDALT